MTKTSSQESSSGIKIYFNNRWNIIKTGFFFLTSMVMAIHIELVGPTMSIVASNINVDYNGMGSVLASRGAGYLLATILGAVLQNIVKKHSEGLLVLSFILPAIVVFTTPFVRSLILMCVLFFIQGIGQAFTDLGGMNILLTMWGANAAAPLNTVQIGYGVGAVLVNLLVRSFLTNKVPSVNVTDNHETNSILVSNDTKKNNSNIVIPYSITAGLCILIAIGYIFFYIRELKIQKQKLEVQEVERTVVNTNSEQVNQIIDKKKFPPYSPQTFGRGYFQYGLILSLTFIFSIFFIVGNDQTFSKFFFTYLNSNKFHLSTIAASSGIILYWLSYSTGRLIFAIISVYLSVTTCLNIVWFASLCLVVTWLIFVWIVGLTETSLFILGAGTGLIFSPIIPLTFALFNQRLNVTPILLAVVLCCAALGMMAFQKIAGFVMDRNPNHFPTLLAVCILVSIFLYIISNIVYFFHRRNLSNTQVLGRNDVVHLSTNFNEEEQQLDNQSKENENK